MRPEPPAAAADESATDPDDTMIANEVHDTSTERGTEPPARDANLVGASNTKAPPETASVEIDSPDSAVRAAEVETDPSSDTADANPISVPEFGVGTRIVNRKLTGESDRFEEGTKVTFWTRVVGGESGERIRHVWLYEGAVIAEIVGTELGGPVVEIEAPPLTDAMTPTLKTRIAALVETVCERRR